MILHWADLLNFCRVCEHFLQVNTLVDRSLANNCASISRVEPKDIWDRLSSFNFVVVVGTMRFWAFTRRRPALSRFIAHRVILLFFPSMTVNTSVFEKTAVKICFSFLFRSPVWALVFSVLENMHFTTEILPIVSINASISWVVLVFFVAVRTPNCLKVKNIKVCISFHFVEEINWKFIFMMGECAHFTKFTRMNIVRKCLAKLCFVFFRVIKVFYGIVSPWTTVSQLAVIWNIAHLWCITSQWSSSIFFISLMVVKAFFWVMRHLALTWLRFKSLEI